MSSMTSGFKATGEKMMDSGLDTALGKFIVEQADVSLDSIEKLMDFYIPAEKGTTSTEEYSVIHVDLSLFFLWLLLFIVTISPPTHWKRLFFQNC